MESGYSTPLPVQRDGQWLALLGSGSSYVAVNLQTSAEVWRMNWVTEFGVNAADPIVAGDRVFIYHSGGASGVVGMAVVRSAARPDPKNPKSEVVDLEFAGRLEPPTTLAEVKQSKKFEDWALVRQGRLSTMAAPEKFVEWMRARYPKAKI